MADASTRPASITTRSELADALTALRETAGLTVRELARRLDAPPGTLGGYFSGRHVPPTTAVPLMRRVLAECGVHDPREVEAWIAAVGRARAASDRRIAPGAVPYRGLRSYEAEDAALFHGRDADTQAVLDRLRALARDPGPSGGLLAVVGPSGSGKSSLLRAGVVAAIRAGALEPELSRLCPVVVPGADPAAALAEVRDATGVVVVDQVEEIFTASDPAARTVFLDDLRARATRAPVVIGMRADFYGPAAREAILLPALQHAQVVVGPMSPDQLRAAVVEPARQVGLRIDDALVELVLAELAPQASGTGAHDAGALPLLSHALLSSWERSTGNRLTVADYRAAGGIDGAVKQTAESLYAALDAAQRGLLRRVLLRLVHVGDDGVVTRRRVPRHELEQLGAGAPGAGEVLERLVADRLITTGEATAEIVHEALLTAWPRLHEWIDEDRAGLRLHRQIIEGARRWTAQSGDEDHLLRGAALATAREWLGDTGGRDLDLTPAEREFVVASVARAENAERRDRRRTRRLRQLLAVAAVLAVVAGVLSVVALSARRDAVAGRRAAATERDLALSRQVAFQARALAGKDPALAEQLALAAYRVAPTEEALSAVMDRSAEEPITRVLGVQGPTALGVAPTGGLVAVSHAGDGSVHLYRLRPGHAPVVLGIAPAHARLDQVFALAFSPDGRVLAEGGMSRVVRLWDVADPQHPRLLSTPAGRFSGAIQSLVISPDGSRLVGTSAAPHAIMQWDIRTALSPRRLPDPIGVPPTATVQSVAYSADGRQLAAGGTSGLLLVWPAATASTTRPRSVGTGTVTNDSVAFDPTRPLLYAGDRQGVVTAWRLDTRTPRPARTLAGNTNSQVNVIALSPDGSTLAVGSSDSSLRLWSTRSWAALQSTDNPGPVTGAAYTPDGSTLLSTAADGTLRLRPASIHTIPVDGSTVFNALYSRDGRRLLLITNGPTGSARLWDVKDPDLPRPLGPPVVPRSGAVAGAGAMNPQGTLVAAASADGRVDLFDTRDPARPRAVTPRPLTVSGKLVESIVFSPDGRTMAVAGDDHRIHVYDVSRPARPRLRATVGGGDLMLSAAFSSNGRMLAGADADDSAYLWDLASPARPHRLARLTGFASYVYGVAFSPDDHLLAVSSADHTTRLWRLAPASRPRRFGRALIGPTDYAYSAAFSPGGHTLAVSSNDGTVRLYRIGDRPSVLPSETLQGVGGPAFVTAFSPDGSTLVGAGRAPGVATWMLDPRRYALQLCPLVGDPITRQEWALYVRGARYNPPCT